MRIGHSKLRVGPRTAKTAAAVIVAMAIVEAYGATSSKLIFAMMGAMAAVQPTFKESWESCLTQIIGVLFGAVTGVLLLNLPISHFMAAGIGIIMVITLYNALHIRFSPSLSCVIVVMICTTADIQPMTYALGRIWDTAIGLGTGMLINTLIFPYDNRKQIQDTMESLDREVILFMEEMFDGDDLLPDTELMIGKVNDIARQLTIFSNQRFLMKRNRQRQELDQFRICEDKVQQMVAQMGVLCRIGRPGHLNEENLALLVSSGANIKNQNTVQSVQEVDVVTNYHVREIMTLRHDLLETCKKRENNS